MANFLSVNPSTENYWRGIILLGRNVATYKLALAKSLLELSASGNNFVSMEKLAIPYTRHLTEHLKLAEKQITSRSSRFINACQEFNQGSATQETLIDAAVSFGFNNVIDAFHIVNQEEVPVRFFSDDRKIKNGITLTDDLINLGTGPQSTNLPAEVEARWRLVETAWALALPPSMIEVQCSDLDQSLFIERHSSRINITGCREALNGYQKGRCFYCSYPLKIGENVDVDHFFPLVLSRFPEFSKLNLNGVWNLVLSCPRCNRGSGGKFSLVPTICYLEKLHSRNQFFIESNHPLRETLMNQTGQSEKNRRDFLNYVDTEAISFLLHRWEPIHE